MSTNVVCESPADFIRVARFVRPDLRIELYDREAIEDTELFGELQHEAIEPLPSGGTLVLNFGLVDWFPTSFYRLLLKTREAVRAKKGKVVVCCLTENVREGFDLMGGNRLFESHATEARATATAMAFA
jgi:anti-anti-sigma regulatory factor